MTNTVTKEWIQYLTEQLSKMSTGVLKKNKAKS